MSKSINFNNVKKTYLTVTLADENNTTLLISTPTKSIMDDLVALQDSLTEISEDANVDATDDLYSACARLMSRNKAGITITKERLSEIFDFEDIIIFFNAYMEFLTEVTSSKN